MASDVLKFPEHAWREGKASSAVEVSIDFLPEEYEGDWHRVVHQFTSRRLQDKPSEKVGTIWMWGCASGNLISRHPAYPTPSWSDFLISFGLGNGFTAALADHLGVAFKGQAALTEVLIPRRNDGWVPICHVENGQAWTQVDAEQWLIFAPE